MDNNHKSTLQLTYDDYIRMNYNNLKSFALKLTKNRMDAEDLVQETAIKIVKNYHNFITGSNFKNWALTILKNTFLTNLRKKKREKIVSLPVEQMEFARSKPELPILDQGSSKNMEKLKKCI